MLLLHFQSKIQRPFWSENEVELTKNNFYLLISSSWLFTFWFNCQKICLLKILISVIFLGSYLHKNGENYCHKIFLPEAFKHFSKIICGGRNQSIIHYDLIACCCCYHNHMLFYASAVVTIATV